LPRVVLGRSGIDKPDYRHRRLLRAPGYRPCCYRARLVR
jgi:hypothetical protein